MEISSLFFMLSIGFYVFLYWRSQADAQVPYQTNRRKNPRLRRRIGDRSDVEPIVLNHLFEDDSDQNHTTNH